MGDQGGLPLNFHVRNFFTQLLDHSRDSSCYNDTTLVCKDKTIFINKVLLSLAFTSTESVLFSLEHMVDMVVMFPDYTAGELITTIRALLIDIKTEHHEDFEEKDDYSKKDNSDHWEKDYSGKKYGFEELDNSLNNKNCDTLIGDQERKEEEDEECEFSFVTMEQDEETLKIESNNDDGTELQKDATLQIKCRFCREIFSTEDEKQEHEKSYRDRNGELVCRFEGCKVQSKSGTFKSEKCLSSHIRLCHYAKAVKHFTCKICDETFVGDVAYQIHMQRYKIGPNNYKCPEKDCKSRFQFRHALISHLKKHRGILDFTCEECSKQFPTKSGLTTHIKQCHENVEQICHICSRIFTKKATYWWHMRNAHVSDEEKVRLKCKLCDKGFLNKETLKRHKVVHSDVYNFPCSTCGKKFKFKQSWEKHMRAHRGEKPFKCDHCGKSFSTAEKVRRHELIHTGIMEFSCSKCDKKFNQKGNKETHEKKYHGEN